MENIKTKTSNVATAAEHEFFTDYNASLKLFYVTVITDCSSATDV